MGALIFAYAVIGLILIAFEQDVRRDERKRARRRGGFDAHMRRTFPTYYPMGRR
jgi:hypothetical protein